ncbi:MAG TPA: exosortase/archaeosortase family protein [Myxococcota bacterium]|nr:exosortase/archaeosortase family protein [Myxococcota bacterium]
MSRTRSDEIALWVALAVVFVPGVIALAQRWASAEYFQHGFLVPVVSLAAAHPRIRGLGPSERHGRALAGLAAALAGYALGLVAGEVALTGVALVGAIAAMVGYRWGVSGLRRLAFPLAFLLFMVPPPEPTVLPVATWLQTLASAGAVAVLHALGVAVLRDGNVMHLPGGGALFVAEACSGITSLLSLIPVGVLLARFTQTRTWQRIALVASVVPAALLGNVIRVIATVIAAGTYGVDRATSGALHEFAGVLTSAFAVLLVVTFGMALARWTERVPARRARA